jgi:hypothetical protein
MVIKRTRNGWDRDAQLDSNVINGNIHSFHAPSHLVAQFYDKNWDHLPKSASKDNNNLEVMQIYPQNMKMMKPSSQFCNERVPFIVYPTAYCIILLF